MKFLKHDDGVAGLNILLSVVVLLFVIGFIIMIFSILGAEVEQSVWSDSTGTQANDTQAAVTEAGVSLLRQADNSPVCTLVYATNATGGEQFAIANWSLTECVVSFVGTANDDGIGLNNSDTAINFTYTFATKINNTASLVIFDSSDELSGTTDWFSIIIVLTAMVVLILLTVIIITTIQSTGLGTTGSARVPRTTA